MTVQNNNKKGMTLVELIISSVVTVIVISAACTVLYFGYSNYMSGTTDLSNHQNASLLEDYLQHDLSTATSVTVGAEQTSATSADSTKSGGDKIICMHFDNNVFVIEEKDSHGTSTTRITGIESVSLNTVTVGNTQKLNYEIKASSKSKQSFLLTGGIIMNNCSDCTVNTTISTDTTSNIDTTHYLNIQMPGSTSSSATS